jgi:hypothetical protein
MEYKFYPKFNIKIIVKLIAIWTLVMFVLMVLMQRSKGYFPDWGQLLYSLTPVGVAAIAFAIAKLFYANPLMVNHKGISGYTLRFKYRDIPWNQLDEVGTLSSYGFRFVIVRSVSLKREIHFSDSMDEWDVFVDAVEKNAGPDHKLTKFLKERPD